MTNTVVKLKYSRDLETITEIDMNDLARHTIQQQIARMSIA
jgi:hypothetical protein